MLGEISAAMVGGPDGAPFCAFMDAYGEWCKFSGIMGYGGKGQGAPAPAISDQAALEVDRAMRPIKQDPQRWWLFTAYWLRGLDVVEILTQMQRMSDCPLSWRYATVISIGQWLGDIRAQVYLGLGGGGE